MGWRMSLDWARGQCCLDQQHWHFAESEPVTNQTAQNYSVPHANALRTFAAACLGKSIPLEAQRDGCLAAAADDVLDPNFRSR